MEHQKSVATAMNIKNNVKIKNVFTVLSVMALGYWS